MDVVRYKGMVVKVGTITVMATSLPDWNLSYITFPPGEMKEYRTALQKAKVNLVRVTEGRIYFEER